MKLNYKRTILIGLAFLSICAFWQFYDNEIPRILKYNFNLGETATGFIMAFDNILALFLLPIFGVLSDKTDSRFGKRTPYIVVGTIVAVTALSVLILVAKPSGNLPFFVVILLVLLIAMGTYRSPAVSLMPELTPAPLRSQGNAIINLMGALGGVFTLVMTMVLLKSAENEADTNYLPLMLSIVILMLLAVAILVATINENKIKKQIEEEGGLHSLGEEIESDMEENKGKGAKLPKDVFKSLVFLLLSVAFWYMAYNAVTTAYTRYVEEVWHLQDGYAGTLLIATVAAVLSYIPIGFISSKVGRKKTILAGVVIMTVCYLVAALMPVYSSSINIFFALIGIGWAAINVNSYPMVVEMSRAGDIGKYTGTYYTFSMAAQVLTPILSGFLLEHVSYRTLFPYAVVFSCLAFCTMMMVKHGDVKPPKKEKILEHFDVDD
ncbi:MFS transporter [Butyrivibrio hungatei]|uniref:MFS transporter n=1 Tax=Butyrivibrio hungatei TaxID=185008 RepID=A0A1D9P2A6_9FIRM|nr:MFS transporter [Butyrivibrio hungatei]AOZ96629.1 MFS transporter [Butyrivibrio hungatei]